MLGPLPHAIGGDHRQSPWGPIPKINKKEQFNDLSDPRPCAQHVRSRHQEGGGPSGAADSHSDFNVFRGDR
jgi:hypothetical protein